MKRVNIIHSLPQGCEETSTVLPFCPVLSDHSLPCEPAMSPSWSSSVFTRFLNHGSNPEMTEGRRRGMRSNEV